MEWTRLTNKWPRRLRGAATRARLATILMVVVLLGGCLGSRPEGEAGPPPWTEVLRREGEIHWMEVLDDWFVWREWTGSADGGDLSATLWAYNAREDMLERVASAPNMNGPIPCGDEIVYSIHPSGPGGLSEAHAWQPGSTPRRLAGGDWMMACGDDWKGFLEAFEVEDRVLYNYTIVWNDETVVAFPREPQSTVLGTIDGRPYFSTRDGDETTFHAVQPDGSVATAAEVPYVVKAFSGDGEVLSFLGGRTGEQEAMYAVRWPAGEVQRLNPEPWRSQVSLAWNGRIIVYQELPDGTEKQVRAIDLEDGSDQTWPIPHPGRSHATLAVTDHAVFVALVEERPGGAQSVLYRLDVTL